MSILADPMMMMYILYAVMMLFSAVGGFALSMRMQASERLKKLGTAHSAGLFLGVALCHMLDDAYTHFGKFCAQHDLEINFPVVPCLVGLAFVILEISDASFDTDVEGHAHGGKSHHNGHGHASHTEMTQPVAYPSASDTPGCDMCEMCCPCCPSPGPTTNANRNMDDASWKCYKWILVLTFIMVSPIALLISAYLELSENHLVAFLIQGVACGTFLYVDFETVAAMRGWGVRHTCTATIEQMRFKAKLTIFLMSFHAAFDGIAVGTSSGSQAGAIAFAIIVHKFWVSIALGHELERGTEPEGLDEESKRLVVKKPIASDEFIDVCVERVHLTDSVVFFVGFGLMAAVAAVM
mmetsp:Transcript_14636/g.35720  ORF Transcript_14636/g.35720 Transcript_14636/m.35720 type:complete len:352 (-) Transcript_14636:306-1361(-)|eukprot:CAMPEP_0114511932 /NCGR_PEP_ID=MMETSP0109-20121206/14683_1 /TAXON_ID=29199 /ORGANISM="Chlorarachnion reptans, Strain CCCM449" /LENGTH=351 /DNA_ID=CAMNT_0001691537 /DNA_START=73 /DNA_END=1128 /DNA_ORIENTATION=-